MRKSGSASAVSALLGAVLVIILVTFLAFALSYLSPSDAAVRSFAEMGVAPTEDQLAAKRAELGLDRPLPVQYLSWVAGLLQGDMGSSLRTGKPVIAMLFEALPYTLALSFSSMLLTLVVGIPVGLGCAGRRGGVFDRAMQVLTYVFNSIPSFFIALLLLYVLAVRLRFIDVLGTRDFGGMLLPTLAVSLPLTAWFSRQVRAYALEQLSLPYIDGLRSRGVGEFRILGRHVLRNLAVPLLTLTGISLGMLLGGSAIVESIFNWPGLGYESIAAVGHRDYPFIAAYALTMAAIYLIINCAVDLCCRAADPRIKSFPRAVAVRTRLETPEYAPAEEGENA